MPSQLIDEVRVIATFAADDEVAKVATTSNGKTVLEVAGRPTFELNGVALSIWTKLEAGHSPEEISSQIASEYSAPPELAALDVKRFIAKLKDNLLVYD